MTPIRLSDLEEFLRLESIWLSYGPAKFFIYLVTATLREVLLQLAK